ncbi:S-layer homology domain-containing protein [Patescibacteria group bacterium]|nr:S-layer homology domain-containing protein [Patescibacteria group bacterium]MBU1473164.1 S-layer homology domain-containing protein [Patescibacteria group bacterium]MBU2459776.1 S-layer homology domain-containing protein [Patescibacteria group bacterium]MBU2544619.1 S-layer homology domain-containing protein [Patescibacteria group bacterium]
MKKTYYKKLLLAAVGFIALSIALVVTLYAVRKNQELRRKAAVPGGPASIVLSPSSKDFPIGTPVALTLSANIVDKAVDGFQVSASFSGNLPADLSFEPASISGLILAKNTLESANGGKILKLAFLTQNPSQPYANISFITLGQIAMTPREAGTITITYDTTLTKIAQNKTAQDIVNIPQEQTYIFTPPPTPTTPPAPTTSPVPIFGAVDWFHLYAWLKFDQFAIRFHEKYFTGKPDTNTSQQIFTSPTALRVAWTESGESMQFIVAYHLDKNQYKNIIDHITVYRGSQGMRLSADWTAKAGYPYIFNSNDPVIVASADNSVQIIYKNIYWHPNIYPLLDLEKTQWSWKHIQKILPTNIMPPVSSETFAPVNEITRADMALFLSRAYEFITKQTAPVVDTPFTDIGSLTEEVQTAIKKIYGLKVTAGTSETTYSPEMKVNRAQMATFLSNLYKTVKGDFAPEVPTPFTDIWNDDIKWAQKPIARIYGLKVTAGISATEFGPYLITNREQMATFIMSFVEAIEK